MDIKKKYINTVVITLLILSCVYLIMYPKSQIPKDLPIIKSRGVLHIVTNYDLIGYHASGDTVAGFNHDLLQLLKKHINVKFDITVENSLEKSFDGLKSDKYDVIACIIPINSELKNEFNFTNPIILGKEILVQRNETYNKGIAPIRNHMDLAKRRIYVSKNSPAILRLRNLASEIGDTIYIIQNSTYDAQNLAKMVAGGEIDYAVCDENVAQKMSEKLPQLDIKTNIGFTNLGAWAVRKDAPILRDSLNSWIAKEQKTEAYKQMLKHYY